MSFTDNKRSISLPVNGDHSTAMGKFAKGVGAGIEPCGVAGEGALGVIQSNDGTAAGRPVETAISGACKVVAGGVVPAWSEIATNATGQAVVAVAGDVVLGYNIEAGAAAGDLIAVVFNPGFIKAV